MKTSFQKPIVTSSAGQVPLATTGTQAQEPRAGETRKEGVEAPAQDNTPITDRKLALDVIHTFMTKVLKVSSEDELLRHLNALVSAARTAVPGIDAPLREAGALDQDARAL